MAKACRRTALEAGSGLIASLWNCIRLSFFWLVVGLLLTEPARADNALTGLRIGTVKIDQQEGFRLVIETKTSITANLSLLKSPYRLVIDMPSTVWEVGELATQGRLGLTIASGYRFGEPRPGIGRLVIDLDRPAAPVRVFGLPPNAGGYRFVIDLLDRGETAFRVAAAALKKTPLIDFGTESKGLDTRQAASVVTATAPVKALPLPKLGPAEVLPTSPAVKIAVPQSRPRRWVVFVDAGHGGKDPGAIGRAGTKEKVITLAAAKELAIQLKATGKIVPVLARVDDSFLRLRERIQLARGKRADIFISLHADSARSSGARGMSVFTLSDKASDKEAAVLARNENKADLIGGPDLSEEDPEAAGALVRMFQRESMNHSTYLANAILSQIMDLPGGDKRGHRFAGFAVLKAPDIPSVLVEMGFLSNRQDEANLRKSNYLRDLARRLTRAIVNYLTEHGPRL